MSVYPKVSYAGFGRRFVAFFFDTTLVSFISLGVQMLLGVSPFLPAIPHQSVSHYLLVRMVIPGLVSSLFVIGCWLVYRGQTLGKWLMHIRIVMADGKNINVKAAIIRYISYSVSGVFFGLGYLVMYLNEDRQTIHDWLAKTYVIRDEKSRPSLFVYVCMMLVPLLVLTAYTWVMLISHGLVVTPSDLKARYKDIQGLSYVFNMAPGAKVHYNNAQKYLDQINDLNIYKEEDAKTARPVARQAVEELKLAINLDPKNPILYVRLAAAFAKLDGDPAALKEYDNAMIAYRLDPQETRTAYIAGSALLRLGRYPEALTMFGTSIALDHTNVSALRSLGVTYEYLKRYQEARNSYEKAIEMYIKQNSSGIYDPKISELKQIVSNLPK